MFIRVLGGIAFAAGFILAVIGGAASPGSGGVALALVILGIIVGLFNITGKEVIPFLVAAIALVVVGNAKPGPFEALNKIVGTQGADGNYTDGLGNNLNDIVRTISVFMTPAAIIGAIRAIVAVARPGDSTA